MENTASYLSLICWTFGPTLEGPGASQVQNYDPDEQIVRITYSTRDGVTVEGKCQYTRLPDDTLTADFVDKMCFVSAAWLLLESEGRLDDVAIAETRKTWREVVTTVLAAYGQPFVPDPRKRTEDEAPVEKPLTLNNTCREALEMAPDRKVQSHRILDMLDAAETQEHVFWGKELVVSYRLANGFTVTGRAACVDAKNFDLQKGRDIARRDAEEQLWPLEGYLLQNLLAD